MTATADATFPGRNGPIAFHAGPLPVPPGFPWPLFVARPDGTQQALLDDRPGLSSDWSADGRQIAFDFFDTRGDQQVATSDATGGKRRAITSGPGIHEAPSWAPDGRRIAFDFSPTADSNAPGFDTRLWTMREDGEAQHALPMRNPGFDVEPRYSPNGRWIVFDRLRLTPAGDQLQAVHLVPANGGRAWRLTPWHANAEHPTSSPDSRRIAFDLPEGTIQTVRPDGSNRRTIIAAGDPMTVRKPWFSPDGHGLLFMCAFHGAGGDDDLCISRTNGSDVRDITNTPSRGENGPSWGPAARR